MQVIEALPEETLFTCGLYPWMNKNTLAMYFTEMKSRQSFRHQRPHAAGAPDELQQPVIPREHIDRFIRAYPTLGAMFPAGLDSFRQGRAAAVHYSLPIRWRSRSIALPGRLPG